MYGKHFYWSSMGNEMSTGDPHVRDLCYLGGDAFQINMRTGPHRLGSLPWCPHAPQKPNAVIYDCEICSYKKRLPHSTHVISCFMVMRMVVSYHLTVKIVSAHTTFKCLCASVTLAKSL